VKRIELECRRQLAGGLLPLAKRLRVAKSLLPLALEDACQQQKTAPLGATKFEKVNVQFN